MCYALHGGPRSRRPHWPLRAAGRCRSQRATRALSVRRARAPPWRADDSESEFLNLYVRHRVRTAATVLLLAENGFYRMAGSGARVTSARSALDRRRTAGVGRGERATERGARQDVYREGIVNQESWRCCALAVIDCLQGTCSHRPSSCSPCPSLPRSSRTGPSRGSDVGDVGGRVWARVGIPAANMAHGRLPPQNLSRSTRTALHS